MKNYLFRISSTVLALATGLLATATEPLSERRTAPQPITRHSVTEAPATQPSRPMVQKICTEKPASNGGLFRSVRGITSPITSTRKAPAKAAGSKDDLPPLRGMVVAGNNFQYSDAGLYDLSEGGNTMFVAGPNAQGGIEVDGVYYTHYYGRSLWGDGMFGAIYGYDLQTKQQCYSTMDTSPIQGAIGGLAKDPTDGSVYAITFNNTSEALQLTKFTYGNYVGYTRVCPADESYNYNSIACDKDGQLYVITYEYEGSQETYNVTSSSLYKLDKTTAEMTFVGNTGELPYGASGATIDASTNRMFWTVYTIEGEGYLCEVDLTTGAATKLYDFTDDEQVTGLCIPEPVAKPGAPAAPTDFSIDFPRGSFSGTINFKMPTTTYDGTPATGEVNYIFTCSYSKLEGTAAYGEEVSIPFSVTYASYFNFEGYLYNDAGKSPKVFDKVFIGRGIPKAPAVTMTRDGNKVDLKWDAVTESSDGGFIDPDSVVYTVRRYVNEEPEIVADSITYTGFSDVVSDSETPTTIYYTVQAIASIKSSTESKTEGLISGSITPPYSNDFATADKFGGFRVIDNNADGKTWILYKSYSGVDVKCTYSYSNPKDDWLVTPPVNLKAGKAYRIGFKSKTSSYSASRYETFELWLGTEPTVEGLSTELLPETKVNSYKYTEYGALALPETDGQYYFGIHATTPKGNNYDLFIDDITIEEVDCALLPGVVTDLKITPDPMGALKADISFNAPSVALDNSALEALEYIVIRRDHVAVDTLYTATPGAAMSCVDEPTKAGYTTYSVQAYTATGGGKEVSTTVFVGVNRPAPPQNVRMEETENFGEVRFSWDAVTTDVDGAPINPELITYAICIPVDLGYAIYYQPIYDQIEGTEFVARVCEPGEQTFIEYIVCARTTGGLSNGTPTDLLAVGTPYESIHESFADGYAHYAFHTSGNEDSKWILGTDATFYGVGPQDKDNGFLFMSVNYIDYYAELTSAKIKLPADNAAMQLYVFNFAQIEGYGEYKNTLDVYVREVGKADYTRLGKPTSISELAAGPDCWAPLGISLANYAGKTVQIKIRGTALNDALILIDNLRIGRILTKDAEVTVSAPASVRAGQEYSAVVSVNNVGLEPVGDISVKLYADGQNVGSSAVADILPGTSKTISFPMTMHTLAERPVALVATISLDDDENIANNASAIASVTPKVLNYPAVTDLEGHVGDDGIVVLSWSTPDLSKSPAVATTDDFEDAESFATEYSDWVFVDLDKEPIAGIVGIDMPIAIESLQSFWVHDSEWEGVFNDAFQGHSGTHYLASMCTYSGKQCNDWAITPALSGQAQEVTFWAKSFHPNYPERMQVYYSTGSTDPKDFTIVLDRIVVPNEWTRYAADIPAGAKRVGIRKLSVDGFMLFIDDVQFAREGAEPNTNILGYDVFRDSNKVTESPVAATTWADEQPADGTYEYSVVTVFDQGMSRASNVVTVAVETSGIDEVELDTEADYYNLQGIRVSNPFRGRIYICRKGAEVSKVFIR